MNQENIDYKEFEEKYPSDSLKKLPEARIRKLDLDYKYQKIDEYTYEKGVFELTFVGSDKDRQIERLNLDLKYGKITQSDYDKDYYDILEKPWRKIIDLYDPKVVDSDVFGFTIGIDYNKTFIKELRKRKYVGSTDDEVVLSWFNECYLNDEERNMTEIKKESRQDDIA